MTICRRNDTIEKRIDPRGRQGRDVIFSFGPDFAT